MLRVCFYGDDFTGSSDALAQFHRFGLSGKLYFALPTADVAAHAAERYDVLGVAGIARSLPTAKIAAEVRPVFEHFARLRPALVQYKICSTFDSSPSIGSFGAALGAADDVFGPKTIPFVPAQPEFGRYTVFGNHFARAGDGAVYRLDRHPTMSRHPSTPMHEADLRRVLAEQTDLPVALFDLRHVRWTLDDARGALASIVDGRARAIVFDAVEQSDLVRIAELVEAAIPDRPLVAFGSGGLSYGYGALLEPRGESPRAASVLADVEKVAVISGSRAPQTAEQIAWALANGWQGVAFPAQAWEAEREGLLEETIERAVRAYRASDRGVVVYSALGPGEAAVGETDEPERRTAALGNALARVLRGLVGEGARRAVVCGGDTSSYAMRALGGSAVEVLATIAVAASMCRLEAPDPAIDGLEVLLKGGQVGSADLFGRARTPASFL